MKAYFSKTEGITFRDSKRFIDLNFNQDRPHRYIAKVAYNEDTKPILSILRQALRSLGYKVRFRGSGRRSPLNRPDGLDLRHYDQSLPLEFAETIRIYIDK